MTGDVRLLEGEELAGHSKSELDDLDICSRHTVDVEWTKCWKALSGQFVQNGANMDPIANRMWKYLSQNFKWRYLVW